MYRGGSFPGGGLPGQVLVQTSGGPIWYWPSSPQLEPTLFGAGILWLDARDLADGAVTTWFDRSVAGADFDGTGHTPTAGPNVNGIQSVGSIDLTHYLANPAFTGLNGKTVGSLILAVRWGSNAGVARSPFGLGVNPGLRILGNYLAGGDLVALGDAGAGYAQDTAFIAGDYVIIATFDRAAIGEVNLYIDGVLSNDAILDGMAGNFATAAARIGHSGFGVGFEYPFDAGSEVMFVGMYDRIITAPEIAFFTAALRSGWAL